jgi:hypothetical protein
VNYSGIDLHSSNSVVSVIAETDRVVAVRRLPNDLAKIMVFLAPFKLVRPQCRGTGLSVGRSRQWY